MTSTDGIEDAKTANPPNHRRTMYRTFWGTIFALAIASIGLAMIGYKRVANPPTALGPHTQSSQSGGQIEIQPTMLEMLLNSAARKANDAVAKNIDVALAEIYDPVYGSIPGYATFHYSVLGEYTELAEAALGKMSNGIQQRLYAGFDTRINAAIAKLDDDFTRAYRQTLNEEIGAILPDGVEALKLGPLTRVALDDAMGRAKITVPIASAAAAMAGSVILKTLTATMAKKLTVKIAAKATAKGVAKTGGIAAGAGGGALLCSWTGPIAAACAAGGAVIAWFAADALVVNLDEYFNRDDFEADLRQMIDADRQSKKQQLLSALASKTAAMLRASKDFKLRDLGGDGGDSDGGVDESGGGTE